MLGSRPFEQDDLSLLEKLAEAHPVWKEEEFGDKDAEDYIISYSMYNGSWLVWEKTVCLLPSATILSGLLQTVSRGSERS